MEICQQSITLGPSASKLTNSPSLWRPELTQRSNVGYFWALEPQRRRQYHTLGLRGGRRRPGAMESCKQSITLGLWASTNGPSLCAPELTQHNDNSYFWALEPQRRRQYYTLGPGPELRKRSNVCHVWALEPQGRRPYRTLGPRIAQTQ